MPTPYDLTETKVVRLKLKERFGAERLRKLCSGPANPKHAAV